MVSNERKKRYPVCCLCVEFVIVSLLHSAVGFNNILNLPEVLGNKLNNANDQNPFDPAFMDPGNFNAVRKPPSGVDTCIVNVIDCNVTYPYRTYDGTCNNLAHPTWGKAGECHPRILEAHYEGEYGLRRSVLGGPLPLVRDMVVKELGNRDRPANDASLFLTIFGQMVSHDMTDRGLLLGIDSSCCRNAENEMNSSICANIYVQPDDPFYSKLNISCLEFHRSTPCPECVSDKRQTLNLITASLDGSVIYGDSEKKALKLRTLDGTGRMMVEKTEFGDLLPRLLESDPRPDWCPVLERRQCFNTGDFRVNQHATLMSVETLLMREHNNVVVRLGTLNPHWDEETRFQEARRIIAAELQNIVYSEYLPALLGPAYLSHYNLSVLTNNNKGTNYDPAIRIGIWNEFSSATFRLHSMVSTKVGVGKRAFKDYYSDWQLLREGKMDEIIQGTCRIRSQKNDHWFPKDVSEHLPPPNLKDRNSPFGVDLVAIDLQRGRDNGIAPYVDVLRHLTAGRMDVTKFRDLSPLMPWTNIRRLRRLYKDVRDVDLIVGHIMENAVPGSNLGPTAAAIVSMQFNNVKFGDRFYFEHEGQAGSFSTDQRENLKKTTMARILCDNLGIKSIQRNPFYIASEKNPMVNCEDIPPSLDLTPWMTLPI